MSITWNPGLWPPFYGNNTTRVAIMFFYAIGGHWHIKPSNPKSDIDGLYARMQFYSIFSPIYWSKICLQELLEIQVPIRGLTHVTPSSDHRELCIRRRSRVSDSSTCCCLPIPHLVHFLYLFWIEYLHYHGLDMNLTQVTDLGLMCILCDVSLHVDAGRPGLHSWP